MFKLSFLATFAVTFWLLFLPVAQAETAFLPQDNTSATVLVYHRIGEDEHPDSSIRLNQFRSQIDELLSGSYHVIAIPELMEALDEGRTLPDRTVAITFDGGYLSAFEKAFPLLLEHDLPFTVFISPGVLTAGHPQFAKTNDLVKLARRSNLVTIGVHPDSYTRLSGEPDAEIRRQINNAITGYRKILGKNPSYFAYPFGEYSQAYYEIVKAVGFKAAFGHQSGSAYRGSDFYALPRFALTESYGDLDRFRLVASALPLPATNISPADPYSTERQPAIGFSVDPALAEGLGNISCFSSRPLTTNTIAGTRVELRFDAPFTGDRARVNCTLPVPAATDDSEEKRWRWLGILLTFPQQEQDGKWLADERRE